MILMDSARPPDEPIPSMPVIGPTSICRLSVLLTEGFGAELGLPDRGWALPAFPKPVSKNVNAVGQGPGKPDSDVVPAPLVFSSVSGAPESPAPGVPPLVINVN